MSLKKATFIIILILLIDQVSKFYIKTHFVLGEEIRVFDWLRILFVENEGMAWGAKIPGEYGKLFLTLFRIVAIGGNWLLALGFGEKEHAHHSYFLRGLDFCGCFGQYYRFGFLRNYL